MGESAWYYDVDLKMVYLQFNSGHWNEEIS